MRMGRFIIAIAAAGLSVATAIAIAALSTPAVAGDARPWTNPNRPIIIDAYEMNVIDWEAMLTDRRIAGFIGKASDGLAESFSCAGDHGGESYAHCRTMWRKYAVSRELYRTRRLLAKTNGLLWGAYHLGRPGNPIDQANHFLEVAEPADDDLMVLDIEEEDVQNFMSLADAELFVRHIKRRTGRYPILYTNHATARAIAAGRRDYPILSRLPLWYARYKPSIRGVFPLGNWESYAIWQFSAMHNCGKRTCPYRVPGTLEDIDVNVVDMTREQLKKAWPFGALLPVRGDPDDVEENTLMVEADTPVIDRVTTATVAASASAISMGPHATPAQPFPPYRHFHGDQ